MPTKMASKFTTRPPVSNPTSSASFASPSLGVGPGDGAGVGDAAGRTAVTCATAALCTLGCVVAKLIPKDWLKVAADTVASSVAAMSALGATSFIAATKANGPLANL